MFLPTMSSTLYYCAFHVYDVPQFKRQVLSSAVEAGAINDDGKKGEEEGAGDSPRGKGK